MPVHQRVMLRPPPLADPAAGVKLRAEQQMPPHRRDQHGLIMGQQRRRITALRYADQNGGRQYRLPHRLRRAIAADRIEAQRRRAEDGPRRK